MGEYIKYHGQGEAGVFRHMDGCEERAHTRLSGSERRGVTEELGRAGEAESVGEDSPCESDQ